MIRARARRLRTLAADLSERLLRPVSRIEVFALFGLLLVLGTVALVVHAHDIHRVDHDEVRLAELQGALHNQVQHEAETHAAQTRATIEARRSNCQSGNRLREGLRINVLQGQKSLPLLLQVLPQLNTPRVLALNREAVARQLRAFAPLNCTKYAEEVLPGHAPHPPLPKPQLLHR